MQYFTVSSDHRIHQSPVATRLHQLHSSNNSEIDYTILKTLLITTFNSFYYMEITKLTYIKKFMPKLKLNNYAFLFSTFDVILTTFSREH